MTHVRMHEDELDIDDALVRGLLRAQQPQWADLPLHRVVSSGTDNAMFRLGDDMVVRLPRIERAVRALTHEQRWLPVLASAPATRGADPARDGRRRARVSVAVGGLLVARRRQRVRGADRRHRRGSPRPRRVHRRPARASTQRTHHRPVEDAEVLHSPSSINRRGKPSRPHEASWTAETVTAAWEAAMGQPSWASRPGLGPWRHRTREPARARRPDPSGHRLRLQRSRRSGVRPPRRLGSLRRALTRGVPGSGERRRRHVGTGPRLGSVHGALGASVLPPHEPA